MLRIAIILFLFCITILEAQSLNVRVHAKSAIVYNPENGAILFEKKAKEPHYPASILKIATALFVLDHKKVDLEKKYTASKTALEMLHADVKQADPMGFASYILEHDGVTMGLEVGKSYELNMLLHGLLLASGNDAANVIAENSSKSIDKFMDELNTYLREKGIEQTRFHNPHGLHHPAQMTTAYDMARIAGLAFAEPLFCQIAGKKVFDSGVGKVIQNTNPLVKDGKYQYSKILGGKTGYIASAGYNLVAAAEDHGRRLVVVLLGCETSEDRFKDAITLFESAFREKKKSRVLFSKDPECFSREVPRASGPLKAGLNQDVAIAYFPSEELELEAKLIWHKLYLPIRTGKLVGKLVVSDERGNTLVTAPLFAANDLEKDSSYAWIWWVVALAALSMGIYLTKKGAKFRKR